MSLLLQSVRTPPVYLWRLFFGEMYRTIFYDLILCPANQLHRNLYYSLLRSPFTSAASRHSWVTVRSTSNNENCFAEIFSSHTLQSCVANTTAPFLSVFIMHRICVYVYEYIVSTRGHRRLAQKLLDHASNIYTLAETKTRRGAKRNEGKKGRAKKVISVEMDCGCWNSSTYSAGQL